MFGRGVCSVGDHGLGCKGGAIWVQMVYTWVCIHLLGITDVTRLFYISCIGLVGCE